MPELSQLPLTTKPPTVVPLSLDMLNVTPLFIVMSVPVSWLFTYLVPVPAKVILVHSLSLTIVCVPNLSYITLALAVISVSVASSLTFVIAKLCVKLPKSTVALLKNSSCPPSIFKPFPVIVFVPPAFSNRVVWKE